MKKIKKILLIDPPVTRPHDFSAARCRVSVFPPLGLAYIAAVLEKKGYEVVIVDALLEGIEAGERDQAEGLYRYGLSDEELAKRIQTAKPDVIGISCLFSNKDWDMRSLAGIAKKVCPECPVVVGGVHPTAIAAELLANEPAIDYVVLGEGEDSFLALLQAIESQQGFETLDGVAYRTAGSVTCAPKTRFITDLDTVPFPARHLLNMQEYSRLGSAHSGYKQKPFASLISSRGCPAKCTFCSIELLWGKIPRYRSAQSILAEIEFLITHYGVKEIHFEDDNLTSNKVRAMQIFNGIIERGFNVSWTVPSGLAIYSLDEELLEKMAQSGCYSISLAIESGDQTVLDKLMCKPIRLERAKPLVDKARSLGMKTKGFFILGFPGETKASMCKTVDFAKSLELDWALFFVATPLVGTKILQVCKDNHYLVDEAIDYAHSFYTGNIRTPEFDGEYVEALKEEANIDINFRHNPNLRRFSVDEAIRDFKGVLDFYSRIWYGHFYLGEAYFKKGQLQLARAEWEKALQCKPDLTEAQRRLKETEVS